MVHRCYACPAHDAFQWGSMPTELARSVDRMRQMHGALQLLVVIEGGYVFTDGAGLDQHHPPRRGAGWRVVLHDSDRCYVGA
eukprot:1884252-Pyramimonas_sp.AAC.1